MKHSLRKALCCWLFFVQLGVPFLVACSSKPPPPPPPQEPKKAKPPPTRIVGRIASIAPDRRFVLIESYGPWNVPEGATLTTHGPNGRAANLVFTGESVGQFAAADLKAGQLEQGDAVLFRPALQTPSLGTEPTATPEPHTQTPAATAPSPPASPQLPPSPPLAR